MIEAGYYWVEWHGESQLGKTDGDGLWWFIGRAEPVRHDFEIFGEVVAHLPGLPYETTRTDAETIERLTAENRATATTLGAIITDRNQLTENLTATQTRCTELLDESREKGREIDRLRAVLAAKEFPRDRKPPTSWAAESAQAQTIARLQAVGYRLVRRIGDCISMVFERQLPGE